MVGVPQGLLASSRTFGNSSSLVVEKWTLEIP